MPMKTKAAVAWKAGAPLTIEETIPRLVNVLRDKRQRPGLEYLDYQGRTVPW